MRKGRERSKCYYILLFCDEIKMENPKKKIFCHIGNFFWNWEKNILFGIGNGAEFRPQNQVIVSPEQYIEKESCMRQALIWRLMICNDYASKKRFSVAVCCITIE